MAHIGGLWGRYWILPLLPAVYSAVMLWIGDLRWEHVAVSLLVAALAFGTRTTKAFFVLTVPFLLMAWGDDAIRYLIRIFVTSDRILGCSLRNVDLALFSVGPNQTLPDYFAFIMRRYSICWQRSLRHLLDDTPGLFLLAVPRRPATPELLLGRCFSHRSLHGVCGLRFSGGTAVVYSGPRLHYGC